MTTPQLPLPDDVWTRLAADIPSEAVKFRQDGKPTTRDGRTAARYVVYIDAGVVRDRLDAVVPGQWSFRLFRLPNTDLVKEGGEVTGQQFHFRGRLRVGSIVREDVGTGKDYKSASTDAFKRTAARFGIGRSLRAMPQFWVELTSAGRDGKPKEPPAAIYARKLAELAKPATEPPARQTARGGR